MKNELKNKKGITLIALILTIIVLIIIAGIGIGESLNNDGSVERSQDAIAKGELAKIQQVVLENYIKYKQTNNVQYLRGEEMTYEEAQEVEEEFKSIDQDNTEIKLRQYHYETNVDPEDYYYKINKENLMQMGLKKITNNDEYMVNYATGEVFNITQKKTVEGDVLYVYTKDDSQNY